MSILPRNLALAYSSAYTALNNMLTMPGHDPKRLGGYLSLVDRDSGIIEAALLVGECDGPSAKRYYSFSLEKADRLFYHKKHQSSFESRDEPQQMYQGAIKCPHQSLIFSFSGFREEEDEVIALMSAIGSGSIKFEEAKKIGAISGNCLFLAYAMKYGIK